MADDQTILEYIIRAQDQAKAILQQQVALLQQMATGVTTLAEAQKKQAAAAEANASKQVNHLRNISGAAVAASAALSGLASVVTSNLSNALEESVRQASLFQSTFIGLGTIAKSFGQDIDQATMAARDLAKDGLMSVRDSAAGLKNLLAAGFGLPEAINLMKGFKDIASFNRQASLEFGYAIVSATEGIKNQNSLLVDNAGLTKNLTIILKEMGLSEQDMAKVQTDVNVRTKLYNGLLKEMSMASGDAAKLVDTFSGSQSRLAVNIQLLQVAIGDRLLPVIKEFNDTISEIAAFFRTSSTGWAEVARIVVIAGAAFAATGAALVVLLGTLGAIAGAVALLGPALEAIGLTIGGVLTAVGGLSAAMSVLTVGVVEWTGHNKDLTAGLQENTSKMTEARLAQEGYTGSIKEMRAQLDEQSKSLGENKTLWQDLFTILKNDTAPALSEVSKFFGDIKRGFLDAHEATMKMLDDLDRLTGAADGMKIAADRVKQIGSDIRDAIRDMARQPETAESLAKKKALIDLLEQQRFWEGEVAKDEKEQKAATDALAKSEMAYGALIKGQIATTDQYKEKSAELAKNLDLLTTATAHHAGMTKTAVMRLPEMVKLAKELASASREGVAPMDANARAIEQLGKSIERQRRLEQEAIDHAREHENRLRALNRAYVDQTTGVDSLAGKQKLLSDAMKDQKVTFDSGTDALRPFLPLMEDIIQKVEELGAVAPKNFAAMKAAFTALGGVSGLDKLKRENLEKGSAEVTAFLEKQRKIALRYAEVELDQQRKSQELITQFHKNALAATDAAERDSLAKRLRAVQASYNDQLREINIFSERGQEELTALNEWYAAAAAAARKVWKLEFFGPTVEDLKETAAISQARFEEMQKSGEYTANAVRQAWLKAYADMRAADKGRMVSFNKAMDDALEVTAKLLTSIGQMAGDSSGLGKVVKLLGDMVGALQLASQAGESFHRSFAAFANGQVAQGITDMVSGLASAIAAMDQATKSSSRLTNALGGAAAGFKIGASTGNPYAAIGGAIIGGIIGAFRKPEWAKAQADVAKSFGQVISDSLAQAIAKTMKDMHVSQQMAELLHLRDIINEAGGVSKLGSGTTGRPSQNTPEAQATRQTAAIKRMMESLGQLFKMVDVGGKTGAAALEQLNSVFDDMVTNMNENLKGLADGPMLEFIQMVRDTGVEVQSVTKFLLEMADAAGEALNKVVRGIIGSVVDSYDKLDELVSTTIPDLLSKREDLQKRISSEKDPIQLRQLQTELARVEEALAKAFKEADRLNGGITSFVANGQEGFDRMGRIIAVTFAAGIGAGKSFIDMLKSIGPSLDAMAKAAEQFGFTMSDGLKSLLGLRDIVNNNQELADSIDGLNQLMKTLTNLGAMNQSTFEDLGKTAVDMFNRLTEAGATGEQAMALMQPTLQTLWEMQQRFGYAVDEATQKLIDEAVAAGTVGKEHMSASERMVAGIDKMVDRMERLLGYFGVDFPKEAKEGADKATGATEDTGAAVDDVSDGLEDGVQRWKEWGDAAVEAGQRAYEATYGVSYGHSPGGLEDIQERLADLKKRWAENGKAATAGMGEADAALDKHLEILDKVLHDLDRAGMTDFQRTMDDIEMRRQAAIASFLKDMEGAAQELIDIGVAALNKISDMESARTVWEERRRVAEEAAAQAAAWAETLKNINDQLALEMTDDPLANKLLSVQQQRDAAIKQFLASMVGAAQSQIDEGLRSLGMLYDLQAQKIKEQVEQQARDTIQSLRDQVELLREDDPLKHGLLELQQQKQAQIKAFLESMVDASDEQIAEGLKLIEELFGMKQKKIQDDIEKQLQKQQTSNQQNMESGSGTVSWANLLNGPRDTPSAAALAEAVQIALEDGMPRNGQLVIELPIGREIKRYVIDLSKRNNRNGLTPVQSSMIVPRLS